VTTLDLEALDDGPAFPGSFAEVALDAPEDLPTIPSDTRAFTVRGKSRDGSVAALGILAVVDGRARGPLFPVDRACGLFDPSGATSASIAPLLESAIAGDEGLTLLAGGRGADGSARSDLLVVDGKIGSVVRTGLRRRRAGAAAFVIGNRAIVAGGDGDSAIWDDAEVLDLSSATPSFLAPIGLSEPRADAGAVVLASGRALLVGGRGAGGAIATLELLDPDKPIGSTLDLGRLSKPRIAPVVARLATGHIVVLGGHDAVGPVEGVELFDPSARASTSMSFPAAEHVDAVALPSGALLVASAGAGDTTLSLVRLDGVETLGSMPRGARPPRLLAGTDGAPFLFDGTFHRYDPWTFGFAKSTLPLSPDPRTAPFVLDSGLVGALRSSPDGLALEASRYDLRSPLVIDAETLGLGTTSHLCPDRRTARIEREGMVLPPSARVAVTDATYRGVSVRAFARGRDLPAIELRTTLGELVLRVDDDGACAYPKGDADFAELAREPDGSVSVTVGEARRTCTPLVAGSVRVAVSLVAGTGEARVRGVAVTRR
jgi:hypothetical protein